MKTFNQLLAEQPNVHPIMKTQLPTRSEWEASGFKVPDELCSDTHDTIRKLKLSAAALEELIIVKAAVLDEARVALNDLREAIRKLEDR